MNALRARRIDRWLGAPLCFLLTLLSAVRRLFPSRKPESPIRRILFILVTETGGLVAAFPALQEARRRFPGAEIAVLTSEDGLGVLPHLGLTEAGSRYAIRTDSVGVFLLDALRILRRLRGAKIDATVNLEPLSRFGTLLAFACGAQRRVGFERFFDEGRYTGHLITHRVIYNPHLHISQAFLSLVLALEEPSDREPRAKLPLDGFALDAPSSSPSPASREALAAKLERLAPGGRPGRKLVVINPNAGDLAPVRRWPLEHYRSLAHGLLAMPDVLLVFTGSPREREASGAIRAALDATRVLDLTGRTTFDELLALYSGSDLLITNDSGPAHFAGLVGLPALVIFGPETPKIYQPLGDNVQVLYRGLACSPCLSVYNQKRSPCRDNRCLSSITPLEVLEQAKRLLKNSRRTG